MATRIAMAECGGHRNAKRPLKQGPSKHAGLCLRSNRIGAYMSPFVRRVNTSHENDSRN